MHYKTPLELTSPTQDTLNINASVIWLHGLGADGHDFAPIVQKLNVPNVRFILPHAPDMAVSRNNGYVMPAWYDLYGRTGDSKEDEAGISNSQHYVNQLIAQEINRGIHAERIVIAGFSQGGAIALYSALRYPKKLAGVLALSTYLPLKEQLAIEAHPSNKGLSIFMAHGVVDEVITLERCKLSLQTLQSHDYAVNWHEYNMAHSVCLEEISDIQAFLAQVLA